jgi:hypothetical protein
MLSAVQVVRDGDVKAAAPAEAAAAAATPPGAAAAAVAADRVHARHEARREGKGQLTAAPGNGGGEVRRGEALPLRRFVGRLGSHIVGRELDRQVAAQMQRGTCGKAGPCWRASAWRS